jgi:ATP phosphoribosyltransferase
MLKLLIPKGSLEEKTFWIFDQAGIKIRKISERGYDLAINDKRIASVMMLRPQEIPEYVASGDFDFGITGLDWVVERGVKIVKVADLKYSRQGWNKVKVILATDGKNPVEKKSEIKSDARIVTEYPNITKKYFQSIGKKNVRIKFSYGATEGKVPKLADYFVDITETGQTLRANGNKILDVLLESSTYLIAGQSVWRNKEKKQAILEIAELLMRVVRAQDKILIKFNISSAKLKSILKYVPALESPTIARLAGGEKYAVETVAPKCSLSNLITDLRKNGATNILEMEIKGLIP